MPKRNDYIDWNEYFMGVAVLSSMRSKDPSSQVGACIVNDKKHIVGIGYNGLPRGFDDDNFEWSREGGILESKYGPVVHAEPNAIANSISDLEGCSIYVNLHPCHECAKFIVQKGLSDVIYLSDKYAEQDSTILAKRIFEKAGIKTRQFLPSRSSLLVDFYKINH